uniref:Uncharacterized protein n=1 Tax=Rhizophora mucronata TaxID=61149 RepID=A0A2P2PBA2_RHIMU
MWPCSPAALISVVQW